MEGAYRVELLNRNQRMEEQRKREKERERMVSQPILYFPTHQTKPLFSLSISSFFSSYQNHFFLNTLPHFFFSSNVT